MTTNTTLALALAAWVILPQAALCYYNPSTGRWLSRDPIAERGAENIYCFARNSPVTLLDPVGRESTQETWTGGPGSGITFFWSVTDLGKRNPVPSDPAQGIDGALGETTHTWVVNVYTQPCADGRRKVASTGRADVKYWWSVQKDAPITPEQHELHHVALYKTAYQGAFNAIEFLTGWCMCPAKAECVAKLGRAIWKVADVQATYDNHDYDCHFNPSNQKACDALPGDQKALDAARLEGTKVLAECSKMK